MGEIAFRQALLHGLLAAGFTEALLRGWKVERAGARLAFWVMALAFPFLVLPAFLLAAPFRTSDAFVARWAVFASHRWNDVRVAGVGIASLAVALLACAGVALFLRDLVPFVREAWREHREPGWPHESVPEWLSNLVGQLSARLGVTQPAISVIAFEEPLLLVRGAGRHVLVVSSGLLQALNEQRLEAALAHELAHVRARDPLAGWALMAARLAMFWNPAVQLIARAIVEEMERRADQAAAAMTSGGAVAGALARLVEAESMRQAQPNGLRASLHNLTERFHHDTLRARIAAVARPVSIDPPIAIRLVLGGAALGFLLFFVV